MLKTAGFSSFYGWKHFVFFYQFIHQQTLTLLPRLDIKNSAAMYLRVWYCFMTLTSFSLSIYSQVGLPDHPVVLFLTFWGNSLLFFMVSASVYIFTNSTQRFFFSPQHHWHFFSCFLYGSHSNIYEVIFHCGCDLLFSGDYVEQPFMYPLVIDVSSLEKWLFHFFVHFLLDFIFAIEL